MAPAGAYHPLHPSQARRGPEGILRADGLAGCRQGGAVREDRVRPDREGERDAHRGVLGAPVKVRGNNGPKEIL